MKEQQPQYSLLIRYKEEIKKDIELIKTKKKIKTMNGAILFAIKDCVKKL